MAQAAGSWLTDADGRRYVDLVSSWGPMILGHAHPAVVDAVGAAARRGLSFGAPTEGELELAEEIIARMPTVQRVRLVNSGTEAVLSAGPPARGAARPPPGGQFAGPHPRHAHAPPAPGRPRGAPPGRPP